MKKIIKNNKRQFHVVQFLKLPYDNFDAYVCVPNSWIVSHRKTDQNVLVACPIDINTDEFGNRAKKREKIKDNWKIYQAVVKYTTDTYKDADNWILTRNYYDVLETELNIRDSRIEPNLDMMLRSVNTRSWSKFIVDKPQLAVKPYTNPRKPIKKMSIKLSAQPKFNKPYVKKQLKNKDAEFTSTTVNHVNEKVKCQTEEKTLNVEPIPTVFSEENAEVAKNENIEKNIQPDEAKESKLPTTESDLSNMNQSSPPDPISDKQPLMAHQDHEPERSTPGIDVNESTEVTNISQEVQLDNDMADRQSSNEATSDTIEEYCPSQFVFKKRISMTYFKDQHQQSLLQKMSTGQSMQDNDNNRETQLRSVIMDGSNTEPNTLNRAKQPSPPCQNTTTFSNSKLISDLKGIDGGRSTVNRSLSVIKHPIIKERSFKTKSKIKSTPVTHPSKSTIQYHLLPPTTVVKPVLPAAQNYQSEIPKEPVRYTENSTISNASHSIFCFPSSINNMKKNQDISEKNYNPNSSRNIYATKHLLNLAHRSSYFAEQSYGQRHLPTQDANLQQHIPFKNTVRRSDEAQLLRQKDNIQDTKNQSYVTQNQLNPVDQFNHFLLQNNQYLSAHDFYLQQEQLRQDLPRDLYISGLEVASSVRENTENKKFGPQEIIKKTPPPSIPSEVSTAASQSPPSVQKKYLLENPYLQTRFYKRSTEQSNIDRVVHPPNTTVEPIVVTQNIVVQPASTDRLRETQCASANGNFFCQHPFKRKFMINRSTETDIIMKDIQFDSKTVKSAAVESSPTVIDSACQVDVFSLKEAQSLYEKTSSNHEDHIDVNIMSQMESNLDCEMFVEAVSVNIANNVDCPEKSITLESNTKNNTTLIQNPMTSVNEPMNLSTIAERQVPNEFVSLFTNINTTMSASCDLFNNLQSMFVQSVEIYKKMVGTVLGNSEVTARTPSTATSQIFQMAQETQSAEKRAENSNNRDEDHNCVNDVPGKNNNTCEQKFFFPPEYNPNDVKWTLKYQKLIAGLVELLPHSGIYVGYSQITHYKLISKDCKTLAQLLLTEVFSISALSVCTLTAENVKALNCECFKVRPRLYDHAMNILLIFVEKYGLEKSWPPFVYIDVMSGILSQIQEVRAKYGKTIKT